MNKYTIEHYIDALKEDNLLLSSNLYDKKGTTVEFLTFNSKEVKPNTLFICKGATFREEYLGEALEHGAFCYISQRPYFKDLKVPHIFVRDIRKAMAILANIFDNEPWRELDVTAVGGTKGKTTTVFFLKAIADAFLASQGQKPCGLLSSIENFDGSKAVPTRRTTPEAVELQHILRNCVDNGLTKLCMEISSQGLKYDRVTGMRFDTSIFLNIGEDHISPSEHKDFADYFNSKMMMFPMSDKTIVNLDIDHIDEVLAEANKCPQVYTFSSKDESAHFFTYDIHKEDHDIHFSVKHTDEEQGVIFDESFAINLPGLFNVENATAAIAASYLNGIPLKHIKEGLYYGKKPEGRMDVYHSQDEKVIAIVDYAHNGFSFEKLFSSVKEEFSDRKIIAVFGMPGGKAYQRRAETGDIAGKYSDTIILTADDPAKEDVIDICHQIAPHIEEHGTPYAIVEDRVLAIKKAILDVTEDSVVIVTGKGAESNQAVGNGYVDCPKDADTVMDVLEEYNSLHKK